MRVAMSPRVALAEFARDGFDMAVRALAKGWEARPGEEIWPLLRSPNLAVAAPGLAASGAAPQDLPWAVGAESH